MELSRHGSCELTHVRPFKPINELVESFLSGGIVWACTPCFTHRGMKQEENFEKVIVTGAGPMVEWIREGASVVGF